MGFLTIPSMNFDRKEIKNQQYQDPAYSMTGLIPSNKDFAIVKIVDYI